MDTDTARILIVDDEQIVRDSLGEWFRDEGYQADTAESAKVALEKLAGGNWDIFLLDIRMPGIDGLELQRKLKAAHPEAIVIIMTAYASVESAVEAMKQGAYDYIIKPFNPDDLEHTIQKAVERKQLVSENKQLRTKIDELNLMHEIVGTSGFETRAELREQVPYFACPESGFTRLELVYGFTARKIDDAPPVGRADLRPAWLTDRRSPVPLLPEWAPVQGAAVVAHAVLSLVDGHRSISDIADALGPSWGIDPRILDAELQVLLMRLSPQ